MFSTVSFASTSIAKKIDRKVPETTKWHQDLLTQMTKTTSNRVNVLSPVVADRLADYLGFRHFYRHSYSFSLEWGKLEKLVIPLEDIWKKLKNEFQVFLDSLNTR